MSKTKNKIMALLITSSFPVMLLFQNCGQAGSLQVSSNGIAANSSLTAGSDIPKDPDDDTSSSSNGGMVIVPPPSSSPVVDQPTSTPPSSNPVQQPPVVVAPPTSTPSQPPVVVNPPGSQPPVGGAPGQVPQDPNAPAANCRNIRIADIRLSIAGVGQEERTCGGRHNSNGRGDNAPDFQLVDANASVSLNNQKIRIRALKNVEIKNIFIRLNESGNQVLGMDNVVMDLFTPSAQQSGLKLQLEKSVRLQIDEIYELQLEIRAEDQIVANASKCIFKPVIKSVRVVSEKESHESHGRCDHHDGDDHDDEDRDEQHRAGSSHGRR